MDLLFTIAAGPRQCSHSQFESPRDSLPYFTVSNWTLLEPVGRGPRIYNAQEEGGPVIPPGTGFPFRRLLQLAGLLWRYSNPTPRGVFKYWISPKNIYVNTYILVICNSYITGNTLCLRYKAEPVNTPDGNNRCLCWQNMESYYVKAGGIYSNHWALKVYAQRHLAGSVTPIKCSAQNSQKPLPCCILGCSCLPNLFSTLSHLYCTSHRIVHISLQTRSVRKSNCFPHRFLLKNEIGRVPRRFAHARLCETSRNEFKLLIILSGFCIGLNHQNTTCRGWSVENESINWEESGRCLIWSEIPRFAYETPQSGSLLFSRNSCLPLPLHKSVGPQRTLDSMSCEDSEYHCSIVRGLRGQKSRFVLREFGA
jgi:hypothetical protein